MYLGKAVIDGARKSWPMAGVLDFYTSFKKPRMTFGDQSISLDNLVENSLEVRGNEFHFSQYSELKEIPVCDTFDSQSFFAKDYIVKKCLCFLLSFFLAVGSQMVEPYN